MALYETSDIMYHGVMDTEENVNTMDQDVLLGVTTTVTQADIPFLREAGRLGEYAVVYRVSRNQLGGGFGDQDKHPYAWGFRVHQYQNPFSLSQRSSRSSEFHSRPAPLAL